MTRNLLAFGLGMFAVVSFSASNIWAHGGESRVLIERGDSVDAQAGVLSVEFQVVDSKAKTSLGESDFAVMHEKKLHAFFFDPALKEFRHEHPVFVNSKWRVSTKLSVNGNYWFWIQGKIVSDGEEFFSSSRLNIVGGTQANPLPPALGDVRIGTNQGSKASLAPGTIVAKQASMLMLQFSRDDGSQPKLSPYLGELAHIVAVSDDGDSLLHTHPMDSGTSNELNIHATFPTAGQYRLWIQFIDDNVLKVVPLSITVVP